MKIDKSFLMNYLLSSKDNEYILNLYKIYEYSEKITNQNIYKNKVILENLEDKIYTVRGKTMSQKERILFDLKRIIDIYKKNDKKTKSLVDELDSLISLIEDKKLDNEKSIDIIKQKITIIEAKLNIPINYFYCASKSFLNIYDSAYINNQVLIKNIDIYNNKDLFHNNDKQYIKEIKDNYKDDINKINNLYFNDIKEVDK